jgi:signal transduction histidine kinase
MMKPPVDLRCDPNDPGGLLAEIARRDRIITALMNQVQRNLNSPDNDFSLLQTTFMLEEEVRRRTAELEQALQALEQATKAVESAHKRLSDAINAIAEGVALFGPDDRLLLCNETYLQLWGFGPEALGKSFEVLLDEAIDRQMRADPLTKQRRLEAHLSGTGTGQYRFAEGRSVQIRERKTADGCIVGLYADITELVAAQAEALRNEKLASLGRLVVGVAHEINTPLGIALTAASFLEEQTHDFVRLFSANQVRRSDLDNFLKTVDEGSASLLSNLRRAADQVKSFKLVAVDQSSEAKRKFNIRSYIDEILLSLRPQLKKTNHIISISCQENLVIHSFPGAFSQIITNLVINSLVHGFEGQGGGRIDIIVKCDGRELILRYSDNGKGMRDEDAKKIFEPFFTTKRGQGGSGLGMHVVYNLATQTLGGQIDCQTAPAEGMNITIRLPCLAEDADVYRIA